MEKLIEQIFALERQCFAKAWSQQQIKQQFDWPNNWTILADRDQVWQQQQNQCSQKRNIIAYLFAVHDGCRCNIEIFRLAVAPKWRHQGYAGRLLCYMESMASTHSNIWLEVSQHNTKALSFYRKNYFGHINTRKNYYAQGDDAFILSKCLSSAINHD